MSAPAAPKAPLPDETTALFADWQAHLAARGLAAHTRQAYRGDLLRFLVFLSGHLEGPVSRSALAGLALVDFRAWMAHERLRGTSARTLARATSAVRGFYAWLADTGAADNEAVLALRTPKRPRGLPRPVAAPDARAVLDLSEVTPAQAWIAARDRAVLTLLWGAGLRVSEALSLRWSVAPLGETLMVAGKGGKRRNLPVLPVVRAAVEAYRALCPHRPPPDGPLFLGARGGALNDRLVRRAMQQAREALGLPETATPHALRHAFATQLLAAGGDLRAVQELLGHASLSTTQIYTGLDADRLAETHAATHPRGR